MGKILERNFEIKGSQTQIEIALGIDENGMTTAKKLYEFLELNPKNYSHWCKRNILENEFATENEDYCAFVLNDEWGGQATTDYKLTAHFAKKLSMKGNGERAEQAREYFSLIEERTKEAIVNRCELSPQMQALSALVENMVRHELEQKKQARELAEVKDRIESIREVVAINTKTWRDDTSKIISKIGAHLGGNQAFGKVRNESYELLERRLGVSLRKRLLYKRRRMAEEGISKTAREKLTYVDIISEDKKLIEGYMAIVKEMAIKYGIA